MLQLHLRFLSPLLLLSLSACNDETPLRGSLRNCVDDAGCPIGEICATEFGRCVVVDPNDLGPRPATSSDLVERLGPIVFSVPSEGVTSGESGLVSVKLTVLNKHALTLSQVMRSGTVRAKVKDDTIHLWNLRLGSDGGGVTLVDATSGEVRAYVVDLTVSSESELSGPLIPDDYPKSHFSLPGKILVSAQAGGSLDDLHPISFTFPEAKIDGEFDVDGNLLVASIALSDQLLVEGAEGLFRIDEIAIRAHFHGARVPDGWAR
ncbi:MAG: hypothetical protein IT381_04000 [Deltaproteobacteria bacterium]|nr:hypothetical protein [Deltaproteobacteria bacterium]